MSSTPNSTEIGARLLTMLRLQDGINLKINKSWVKAGNPWYRAIWTECAELMDHVGWKWWKKIDLDVEQVHLELVDIFHFGLSELIVAHGTIEAAHVAAKSAYESIETAPAASQIVPVQVLQLVEAFAFASLNTKSFAASAFAELCASVNLGGDQLYRKYVGKNVLNAFRQDHGYKDGSYVKIWSGREDNAWLAEIADSMRASSEAFPSELYDRLAAAYQTHGRLAK